MDLSFCDVLSLQRYVIMQIAYLKREKADYNQSFYCNIVTDDLPHVLRH